MRQIAATLVALALAAPAVEAEDVVEPKSGVKFAAKVDDLSLLGAGLRVKKVLFTFKAYALGFYVADAALAGPLAAYKGKTSSPEFYKTLVEGDFPKQMTLKMLRDLSQSRIQGAMREALEGADKAKTDTFVGYFPEVKEGEEIVLRWAPGGNLDVTVAGKAKAPIAGFAAAVFGIWLRENPVQADIKVDLVSRAESLLN